MYGSEYYGEAYGGGIIVGTEEFRFPDSLINSSIDEKRYLYKIYDPDGNFLGIWNDVVSDLAFNQQINSYSSSVDVELARNSDSLIPLLFDIETEDGQVIEDENGEDVIVSIGTSNQIGPGTTVEENLKVHIYVFYGSDDELITENNQVIISEEGENVLVESGAPNGRLLFRGYISQYTSQYGSSESTKISLISDGDQLADYVIEDDEGNTTVDFDSMDPSDILKSVLDLYAGEGGIMTYDESTIDETSTEVTYEFKTNTSLDGIKKVTELAPADWYGYADLGTDKIHFHPRPTDVDHSFVLGKHIGDFSLVKSIEDMVNVVYFVGGQLEDGTNLFKKYTDDDSIDEYGRKLEILSDSRVTLEDSADILAQGEIDRNKVPRYQTQLDIIDKVYDIESIVLGQLVGFRNFGNYIDDLTLQIVGIAYTPDKVTLQLDTLLPAVSKRVEDLKRNLDALNNQNNPGAPS